MSWRDEIAQAAQYGAIAEVLRIFDMLWVDREQLRRTNSAYLDHIAELRGASRETVLREQCAKAQERLRDALKRLEAVL